MKETYSRILDAVDRLARWVIIAASAAMISIVTLQVALRYGFNMSIDWSDEISRLLFVWCMFLAIPLGLREGAHVGIELLLAHVPAGIRTQLARACALGGAAIMVVVLWQTVEIQVGKYSYVAQARATGSRLLVDLLGIS